MPTSAKIIADNESPEGVRITTFEVRAPRIILAEINTHGVIAKSSESSRAVPVTTRIEGVLADPFIPSIFGKNKKGMQADEFLNEREHDEAFKLWRTAMMGSIAVARQMAALGVHKQLANRLIEPYSYVNTVLTGTEWDNFFALRNHADAQPEFQVLASLMQTLYNTNVPYYGQTEHLPYVTDEEVAQHGVAIARNISAARCARVSYKSHKTGKPSTAEEDIALCGDLIKHGHMSPFDHVAFADRRISSEPTGEVIWERATEQGRFYGWLPYRAVFERDKPTRRRA